jgi:hypothetical protein
MMAEHTHEWQCHASNPKLLECTVPRCGTVTVIKDLIEGTALEARRAARDEIYLFLHKSGWLLADGRKRVKDYLTKRRIHDAPNKNAIPLL